MKFSISFKYQNASFRNRETKETIDYETKAAEGNSFVFDNVDEDVVIGILRGIKDKKASGVFGNDEFRTSFISTIAKNKCKELYDKIEGGEWKMDDITVSHITIKDIEFTKPTMNARETITVESKKMKKWKTLKVESTEETIKVEFKKFPTKYKGEDDDIIAFFPETMKDGSCNPGCLMSYMHTGQHGEASISFYKKCKPASEDEYASLLTELERIYDDTQLVVLN